MVQNGQPDLFAPSAGQERVYTVSELAGAVRALLEEHHGLVRVAGEISGMTRASSGHLYFALKDERAALSAVMFRAAAARMPHEVPDEGTEVECLGRMTFYEPRGRTQLVVESMIPRGAGELGLRFLALKDKLARAGLFDAERKRRLPFVPERIGLVTSPSGAAVRDILTTLARRFPSVPVLLDPVRVQGESAAQEIAQAVERMGSRGYCDVLIVGRGGGSIEDLWAFNEEVVVRAVAACPVPVVSAVGHEVDLVLTDLAADVRAATPTAAAELVVPDRMVLRQSVAERSDDLRRVIGLRLAARRRSLGDTARRLRDPRTVLATHRLRLDDAQRALQVAGSARLHRGRRRLADAHTRLARHHPAGRMGAARVRLEGLYERLRRAGPAIAERRRLFLEQHRAALAGLSPLAVLERGYAVVEDRAGTAVRDAAGVSVGDPVRVRLHRGRLDAIIDRVHPADEEEDK